MSKNDIIVVTEDQIKHAIRAATNCDDFELVEYGIQPASASPLGYLGDHERVKATIKDKNGRREISFFAKKVPTKIQLHREYAEGTKAFYKEIELYKTLFVDMENALTNPSNRRKWRPECYFTRDWDLFIIEDMAATGYVMLTDTPVMDMEHVKACIRTMAQMHANSIIFEEKLNMGKATTKSQLFKAEEGRFLIKDLYPNLIFESECTNEDGHLGGIFWETGVRSQLPIIDLLPGYSEKQKALIKKKLPDVMRLPYEMVKPSKKYRNIILHADLWNNNILFRHEDDGKVTHAIFVDYQMARYAPPAQELTQFLYVAVDRPFRSQHYNDMLQFYYDCMKSELELEGLSIQTLLPKEEFDESCEYFQSCALSYSIMVFQMPNDFSAELLADENFYKQIMCIDRSEVMMDAYKNDERFSTRTNKVLGEVISVFNLDHDDEL